jgi:hypothetical protein
LKLFTPPRARVSRAAKPFAAVTAAGFAFLLGACADDEVRQLGAQTSGDEVPDETAPAGPSFAPEDTATRTVAEAVARQLAQVADSVGALEAQTAAAAVDTTADDSLAATGPAPAPAPAPRYNAGEDPAFARRFGWPVDGPATLAGSILPEKRIICYYGNPNSTRMGILGEFPKDEMLRRLREEVENWNRADPEHPAQPCLHMVAVVAQADAGTSGHYRSIMRDTTVKEVHSWAKEVGGIFFVDIQVGTDRLENILPRFEWILKEPDVHLAVDPEFMMKGGDKPGTRIGTMDAADINYATAELARIVRENNLPPKVLVLHRFTRYMLTNTEQIVLHPEVQIVIDMDGWGAPWLKRDSYRDYIVREPVQYTGFKLFYHNDTKKGDPLMQPADLLKLEPEPLYIQYQ